MEESGKSGANGSELGLKRVKIEVKDDIIMRNVDLNERGRKTMDGSIESRLQMLPRKGNNSFMIRDSNNNDINNNNNGSAITKFEWMNLFSGSSNSKISVVESEGEKERVRNSSSYVCRDDMVDRGGARVGRVRFVDKGEGLNVREYQALLSGERLDNLHLNDSPRVYEDGCRVGLRSNDSSRVLEDGRRLGLYSNDSSRVFEDEGRLGLHSSDNRRSYGLGSVSQCSDHHRGRCDGYTSCYGNERGSSRNVSKERVDRSADLCGDGDNIRSVRCDSYQRIPYSRTDAIVYRSSNEDVKYSRVEHKPNSDTSDCGIYHESERFARVYPSAVSEHVYDQIRKVQSYDDQGDTLVNLNNFDNTREHVSREVSPLQRFRHGLQDEPNVDNPDVNWLVDYPDTAHVTLGPTNTYYDYGIYSNESPSHMTESIVSHDSVLPREVWAYEKDDPHRHYEEGELYASGLERGVYTLDEHSQQRPTWEDVEFSDKHDRKLKRKHESAGQMSNSMQKSSSFHDKDVWSYDDEQLIDEFDKGTFTPTRRVNQHRQFKARKNVVPQTDPMRKFGGLSDALLSRIKPSETSNSDVKSRLTYPQHIHGPSMPHPKSRKQNTKHFAQQPIRGFNAAYSAQFDDLSKGTTLKRKSNAAPQDVFVPLDTQDSKVLDSSEANIEPQQNPSNKTFGIAKEAFHLQETDAEHSKFKLKPAEKDLNEDSEEFKKQVEEFFMRCMLHLCANSDRQQRFKDRGKDGCLKCIICSSSKVFMETKDIAMHAFTSLKVGLRAAHLGFHKALCVLMGWQSAVAPNGRWIVQPLSESHAWALKEDIIIWPPIVIVHNSRHVVDQNPLEQVTSSIGHLKDILKDKGFDMGRTRVCHCGGAENSAIMVVKFSGTLSGLQEAERLNNIFIEQKHGRKDLQQVEDTNEKDTSLQVPIGDIDNYLYGYIGIVEDLDKLGHDMRPHCHAKSKKDILAFANASTS